MSQKRYFPDILISDNKKGFEAVAGLKLVSLLK